MAKPITEDAPAETVTPSTAKALIDQVTNELTKSQRDGVKAKIKEKIAKKLEHQKAINLIDKEIAALVDDFESGVL